MKINLEKITKSYENMDAVRDVSIEIKEGELLSFLGPSGCGKTTLLRIIAGLTQPSSGTVRFDGVDVTYLSPQKRNAAMVFQNHALFPNLTVKENVEFGLKVRKIAKTNRSDLIENVLQRVGLSGYEARSISELSGGQRQRVALARALVIKPKILLFDEPLSSLDQKLRVSTRRFIRNLQQESGITSIYVTHDQEEAMSVSDRVAVMKQGIIQQVAEPKTLYFKPANDFVANFIGKMNFLTCSVTRGRTMVMGKEIQIPHDMVGADTVLATIRPESMFFASRGIPAKVESTEFLGMTSRYYLSTENYGPLVIDTMSAREATLEAGQNVAIDFKAESVLLLPM